MVQSYLVRDHVYDDLVNLVFHQASVLVDRSLWPYLVVYFFKLIFIMCNLQAYFMGI